MQQQNTEMPPGIRQTVDVLVVIKKNEASVMACDSESGEVQYQKDFSFPLNSIEVLNLFDQLNIKDFQVISSSDDFTVVPTELSDSGDHRRWLGELPVNEEREIVLRDVVTAKNLHVFFSVQADHFEFFSQVVPKSQIQHLSKVVINNSDRAPFAAIWSKMVCFFIDKRVFIVAYHHNDIKLANFFGFELPADALYYILWVKKQIFHDSEVPVFINGFIHGKSKLFEVLKSYIKDIHLGTRLNKSKGVDARSDENSHQTELLIGGY
nr:DUF3822 family protein [Saprospiraceae bacterium]